MKCLVEHKCDFVETMWRGEPKFTVRLNNWDMRLDLSKLLT